MDYPVPLILEKGTAPSLPGVTWDPDGRGLAPVTSEEPVQFQDFSESDPSLGLSHPHLFTSF